MWPKMAEMVVGGAGHRVDRHRMEHNWHGCIVVGSISGLSLVGHLGSGPYAHGRRLMNLIGMITGIALAIQNPKSTQAVYNGAKIIYQAQQKSRQGTWKASVHEESHQILKDAIKRAGQR